MADQKITELSPITTLNPTGLLVTVDDVSGSPVTRKIAATSVLDSYNATAAETSAGIIPTNFQFPSDPYDVRRVGIVPDSTAARTANTTALQALMDNTKTGPVGEFVFPNVTGATTYHFDDRIPCRDGVHIDLRGCTLNFTRTGVTADTNGGCFHAIRDFSIENGKIVVVYTFVAGTNVFNALTFGGRASDATDFPSLFDKLLSAPFGDIKVKNIEINYTGGTNSNGIFMLGGLRNCTFENITIQGNNTLAAGIHYEFGQADNPALPQDRESSHAHNMRFTNIVIEDIDDVGPVSGIAVTLTGAYNIDIDGLKVRGAFKGFVARPGEALFFRPWDPDDLAGVKRNISLANVVMSEIESIAIDISGFSTNTGYLSPITIPDRQLVDLYDFEIDGFALLGGTGATTLAVGIATSAGKSDIKNGRIVAATNALRVADEAVQFSVENVHAVDSLSDAFRFTFAAGIFSPERKKTGVIRNCKIVGTTGLALGIDHAENVRIEHCRFGYELSHDGLTETTQTSAISVGADAQVIAKDNYVAAVTGGANAYTGISGGLGVLINALGAVKTASVHWRSEYNSMGTVGDANTTLTVGTSDRTILYDTALTANRVVTLSTTNAHEGAKFRVSRTGLGAFTLDVGGLKTIPASTAAFVDVEYDSAAWKLTGHGLL